METPSEAARWLQVNERVRILADRPHLLVSNTGPKGDGYSYCVKCGCIEASSEQTPLLSAPHRKPFPDERDPTCEGGATTRHLVLGTDFITDIALLSMDVAAPLYLKPGHYPTDVALRTVSEAIAKAGSQMLEIEPGELMAEYRPSLTPEGREGLKAEIFLYDTLPGGAGFSSQLVDRGVELFERALVGERGEQRLIQVLVAQPTDEEFRESILLRLFRCDVVPLDPLLLRPSAGPQCWLVLCCCRRRTWQGGHMPLANPIPAFT
jgi:hypothetical protein